ncbi:hypothetical protein D3C76_1179260 [compost metagenome]
MLQAYQVRGFDSQVAEVVERELGYLVVVLFHEQRRSLEYVGAALPAVDPMNQGQCKFAVLLDIGAGVVFQGLEPCIEKAIEQCGETGRKGVVTLKSDAFRHGAGLLHQGGSQGLTSGMGAERWLATRLVKHQRRLILDTEHQGTGYSLP